MATRLDGFVIATIWLITLSVNGRNCLAQQEYILTEEDTWQLEQAPAPGTPEAELAEARRILAEGDSDRASVIATQWIDRYPRHPLLPEAYLLRGDALLAQNEEYKALYEYEYVARMYPASEAFVTALRRELDIARKYADGYRRKFAGMRLLGAEDEAEEIFIRVQERLPGSRLAEEAGMELADFYFERRQMSLAVTAYELFIENYPHSEHIDRARRRLVYSHLASFKGPEFDAAELYEARARLRELRVLKPAEAQRIGADGILTRIDEMDAQKMLDTARWYQRIGNPIAAERVIRRLVQRYPGTVAVADALRLAPDILVQVPERIAESAPDYHSFTDGNTSSDPAHENPTRMSGEEKPH